MRARAIMVPVSHGIHRTRRLLSFVLCLLILVSSVDRVPDPPSIKPQRGGAVSLAVDSHQSPIVDQDRGLGLVSLAVTGEPHFVDWSLLFAAKPLFRSPIYLRRASDSSPPYSAL
jgi:hypothetical protein